jgi:hypothetical protein
MVLNSDDVKTLKEVLRDTEDLDISDVSEAIVNAMELEGWDRSWAYRIADFGLKHREAFLTS